MEGPRLIYEPEEGMSGLDDLIGSLTKSKPGASHDQGGQASLGMDDLLGGLLGGGSRGGAEAEACRTCSAGSSVAARPGLARAAA